MKKKDKVSFKKILRVFEERSSCLRLQVACLIIKDGRIISTGWNGSPSGVEHCNENPELLLLFPLRDKLDFKHQHREFSEKYEIHAEQNAIGLAAKHGIKLENTSIISSIAPCAQCAKLIITAGIKEVYYVDEYDRNSDGINLLEQCKIKVEKL